MAESNSLLAGSKSADSLLHVQLHPLVILTVSDYITRHTLRQQSGPIVVAIIGSQDGRSITMEHAFECKTVEGRDGEIIVDDAWFKDRLKDFRDVHKVPPLDFVGWFTLASKAGPHPLMLPIHRQLMDEYNESALLMTFTPQSLDTSAASKPDEKLPFTIYETVYEAAAEGEDKTMQGQGETAPALQIRFKELPYTVETGDAEMIGVDFVARGAGNAAVAPVATTPAASKPQEETSLPKGKGKGKEKEKEEPKPEEALTDANTLTSEEEEMIASLTAKANAIRMLHQRIGLLKAYLQSLPPCYLNDSSIKTCEEHPQISYSILRSISALLARLPLLTPSASRDPQSANGAVIPNGNTPISPPLSSFESEAAAERTDVALISLLGSLGKTLQQAQEMGRKAKVFEESRGDKGGRGLGMSNMSGNISANGMGPDENAFFNLMS